MNAASAYVVVVERAHNEHGKAVFSIKLQTAGYEVNIRVPGAEVNKLKKVPSTPWLSGSVRVGRSSGESVFWSCEKRTVSILIGHDDQTWDVGFWVPLKTFKTIIQEIEKCPDFADQGS